MRAFALTCLSCEQEPKQVSVSSQLRGRMTSFDIEVLSELSERGLKGDIAVYMVRICSVFDLGFYVETHCK